MALVALALLAVLVFGGAVLVAWRTTATEEKRPERIEHDLRATPAPDPEATAIRVEIDVRAAQLVLLPARHGQPLAVDADYDPRNYLLDVTSIVRSGTTVQRIVFRPRGSLAMAVLRTKLGAVPPTVRVTMPGGVPVDLDLQLAATFGAVEIGGLAIHDLTGEIRGGALTLSVLEPLADPMETLRLFGDTGSLEVTGLGNASPRDASLKQHLGELDLDLRGAWARDGSVRLFVAAAGGSVWLPSNVRIERDGVPLAPADAELSPPRLLLDIDEHAGRLAIVGP